MTEYIRYPKEHDESSEYNDIITSNVDITFFSICMDYNIDAYTRTLIYPWSLATGYISCDQEYTTNDINQEGIELELMKDIKIMYPSATLNRLSKITKHDYMNGYILRRVWDNTGNTQYYVPDHWPTEIVNYRMTCSINDLVSRFDKVSVEYVSVIGIQLAETIMKIADITVVCND